MSTPKAGLLAAANSLRASADGEIARVVLPTTQMLPRYPRRHEQVLAPRAAEPGGEDEPLAVGGKLGYETVALALLLA